MKDGWVLLLLHILAAKTFSTCPDLDDVDRHRRTRRVHAWATSSASSFFCTAILTPRNSFWLNMSSLWIINKAGGLIYQADRFEGTKRLTSNEALILAGTLHGVHAITTRLNPVPNTQSTGLKSLEADNFRMTVLMTATGTIFVFLRTIYLFYISFRDQIRSGFFSMAPQSTSHTSASLRSIC